MTAATRSRSRPRSVITRSVAMILALGLLVAGPAVAQWKWRDRSGHTQYSDMPPPPNTPEPDILQRPNGRASTPGRPAGVLTTTTAPASAPSSPSAPPLSAARASDPELEARRRQADQEAAAKKRADDARQAAARAENCARAQETKRTVDSGIRITRTNLQGEREYLSDADRAAEARRAQQVIASDCR